ncbi:hypothetical protein K227x_04710 [Rubripirellula lacrimiformis]|uniref:Cytochrome C n=1 Tax=Rubripirellula lacrimiformis TaxID=1930273 RepID=A0A517N4P4_9BACT|nr:hypothetical protein [Rubripirellula lacrimiformis]QDT02100.1 hypothetical protein K227x_04710 [Rubripirellula lacrimiformis]
MKNIFASVLVVAILASTLQADPPSSNESPDPPTKLTPLMRMKLDKSKAILEGLSLEDFDKIAVNARSLRLLSMESGWNVIQTPEYAAQSRDFQRAADLIAEAAKEKDIHRATMGYVSLTVRCVECHSYMRKHRSTPTKPSAK